VHYTPTLGAPDAADCDLVKWWDLSQKVDYPYAQKSNLCRSLRTYELSFASGSDQLECADWSILAATGALLKQGSLRIEVAALYRHTLST
jgi:hypothetical protein